MVLLPTFFLAVFMARRTVLIIYVNDFLDDAFFDHDLLRFFFGAGTNCCTCRATDCTADNGAVSSANSGAHSRPSSPPTAPPTTAPVSIFPANADPETTTAIAPIQNGFHILYALSMLC